MKNSVRTNKSTPLFIGNKMNFELKESFNLLRTNLMLSIPDEKSETGNSCRIFGITSAIRGDGKSMSAINCAYSFSLINKKVLLVDCDLRLPSIYKKLNLSADIGLTDFLTGQFEFNEIITSCKLIPNVDVVTHGQISPNPLSLISSGKMKSFLATASEIYDIIILDMPPIEAVSDPLVLGRMTDGVAVVVRQNYTDAYILRKSLHQLDFANIKILGFIFNSHDTYKKKYYKYYKNYNIKA